MTDINAFIDTEVKSNDVVLFMKGTPQFPCADSRARSCRCSITSASLQGPQRAGERGAARRIKTYTNWPTIPQLYVKGEFVGGCDIVREMFQSGELQAHLMDKGVTLAKAS